MGGLRKIVKNALGAEWYQAVVFVGGGDSHFLHMGASRNNPQAIVVSAGSTTPISYLKKDLNNSPSARPWKSTSLVEGLFLHEGNCGYPGTYFGWLVSQIPQQKYSSPTAITQKEVESALHVFGSCQHWTYESWRDSPPFSILNLSGSVDAVALLFGLTLDYAFSLKSQILDLVDEDSNLERTIVMTGGGANNFLARLLQTILGNRIQIMDSSESVKNVLRLVSSGERLPPSDVLQIQSFSADVRNSLLELEKVHSEIYLTLQGIGEVIQNVA